jgi:hypothetical protein
MGAAATDRTLLTTNANAGVGELAGVQAEVLDIARPAQYVLDVPPPLRSPESGREGLTVTR